MELTTDYPNLELTFTCIEKDGKTYIISFEGHYKEPVPLGRVMNPQGMIMGAIPGDVPCGDTKRKAQRPSQALQHAGAHRVGGIPQIPREEKV